MIPFLKNNPYICAVDSPPFTDSFNLNELFDLYESKEISNLHDSNVNMCPEWCFDDISNEEIFEPDFMQYLLKDCMVSGCGAECAKYHYIDLDQNDHTDTLVCPDEDMHDHEDVQPYVYTPGSDHSYYALSKEVPVKPASDPDILENIPTPPSSFSHSDSSSEDEVDVVTVLEDQLPTMPVFDTPRRKTRAPKKGRKQQQRRTQTAVSAKSLKAALKKSKVQNLRNLQRTKHSIKAYRGRKVFYHSVETTPSSSVQSSAQSSRCNSDTEDCDKREVHNNSERKRRQAQRTALQNLRHRIPALRHNPKAPKVLILNTATSLVKQLQFENETLKETKSYELQKNRELKAKLQELELQFRRSRII